MPNPLVFRLGGAMAVILALVATTEAQWLKHPDPRAPRTAEGKPNLTAPAPRTADGALDLSGLWNAVDGRYLTSLAKPDGLVVPFQPWAEQIYNERLANNAKDRPAGLCLPHAVPDAMLIPGYPWKLVQTPGLVIILFENFTQYRQIFTDGRDFPGERTPNWFGYSIGKWDGDTFVVDSVGFNDKSWLDDTGHPHTEALHVTERFRRRDFGHMEIQFTIDDPRAYTKPWSVTIPFVLLPDTEIVENICENEKDVQHLVGK
jgi:hypothetical protein